MRSDHGFAAAHNYNYSLDPAGRGFFDRVLDQRLAGDREHFL
jgi:hypothetical protein